MGAQADRIAAELTAHVELAAKALVLAITANLIKATPVDTSWARANWVPSIGTPASSVAGSPDSVSTSAQQTGIATALQFKLGAGVLYVSNAVPYIQRLNDGWSKQAPLGFVEFCIDQALQEVQAKFGVDFGINNFRNDALASITEQLAA